MLERGDPNIRGDGRGGHITPTEYFKGFSEIPIVMAAPRKPLNRILEVGRTVTANIRITSDPEGSMNSWGCRGPPGAPRAMANEFITVVLSNS